MTEKAPKPDSVTYCTGSSGDSSTNEKTQTQIGIYPQMFAPTGNYREGLGGGRPNYILPLLAEKSWGKWTLYGNVGYRLEIALDEQSYWYTGAVLQREINDRLSLGFELRRSDIFIETPSKLRPAPEERQQIVPRSITPEF